MENLDTAKQAIFIPSRGRAELLLKRKKHTLTFAQHAKRPVVLIVREQEVLAYKDLAEQFGATIRSTPPGVDSIAATYDWITNNFSTVDKALFLDDDLIFSHRPDFNSSSLKALPPERFREVEVKLFGYLKDNVALTGLVHRRGAQNFTEPIKYNTKIIAAMCCNLDTIREHELKWDWGQASMFDHNMNLELLTLGWDNVACAEYTHDDIFTRFKHEGCSSYRGIEEHSKAALALAEKFPEVVTTREKFYEAQRQFGQDITMRMKKAFGARVAERS